MKRKTIEPIRNKKDILKVENYLKNRNERDFVIWVLGMNSGLRVSDIVGLNVSDVINKTHIAIIEKKTQKTKTFYINNKLRTVLREYTKNKLPNEPLFKGKMGSRLNRSQVNRFIKKACKDVGLTVNVASHTLRKSFGYHHYKQNKDLVILQKIFNHSSPSITRIYIGIEQDEIDLSYKNFEL